MKKDIQQRKMKKDISSYVFGKKVFLDILALVSIFLYNRYIEILKQEQKYLRRPLFTLL